MTALEQAYDILATCEASHATKAVASKLEEVRGCLARARAELMGQVIHLARQQPDLLDALRAGNREAMRAACIQHRDAWNPIARRTQELDRLEAELAELAELAKSYGTDALV